LFILTTAQQLDTNVYSYVASLLLVLAFFGHLQGGIQRKKYTTLANSVVDMQLQI